MYYLQSRFYDPTLCRFVNADSPTNLAANSDFIAYNLYAYCGNNPVSRADTEGQVWHILVGGVAGALMGSAIALVTNIAEGKPLTDGLWTSMLSGAASGMLSATGAGIVGMVIGNAAISMAENAVGQVVDNNGFADFDFGDMVIDGVIGSISGALGGSGKGTKHMMNLGYQSMDRTIDSMINKGVRSGFAEARKAFRYYKKSTRTFYRNFIRGLPSEFASTVGTSVASSDYMKNQYKELFVR